MLLDSTYTHTILPALLHLETLTSIRIESNSKSKLHYMYIMSTSFLMADQRGSRNGSRLVGPKTGAPASRVNRESSFAERISEESFSRRSGTQNCTHKEKFQLVYNSTR